MGRQNGGERKPILRLVPAPEPPVSETIKWFGSEFRNSQDLGVEVKVRVADDDQLYVSLKLSQHDLKALSYVQKTLKGLQNQAHGSNAHVKLFFGGLLRAEGSPQRVASVVAERLTIVSEGRRRVLRELGKFLEHELKQEHIFGLRLRAELNEKEYQLKITLKYSIADHHPRVATALKTFVAHLANHEAHPPKVTIEIQAIDGRPFVSGTPENVGKHLEKTMTDTPTRQPPSRTPGNPPRR